MIKINMAKPKGVACNDFFFHIFDLNGVIWCDDWFEFGIDKMNSSPKTKTDWQWAIHKHERLIQEYGEYK